MQITATFENLEDMMNFCKEMAGGKSDPVTLESAIAGTNLVIPGPSDNKPFVTAIDQPRSYANTSSNPVEIRNTPAPPLSQSVPTAKSEYQQDDLARAAMTLMDSGRQGELLALLQEFGVEALPSLPKDQYGNFATRLRGMGAHI